MKHLNKQNVAQLLVFILINAVMFVVIFFIQPRNQGTDNPYSSSGAVTISDLQVNLFNDVTFSVGLVDHVKTECNDHDCFMTFQLLNNDNIETISYISEYEGEPEITIPASVLKLETFEEAKIQMRLELLDNGNTQEFYSNELEIDFN